MAQLNSLKDIDENIFMKDNIKGIWRKSTASEVLANLLEETSPFDKETKKLIPVFGFNKLDQYRDNKQLFPTNFVILELDTPGFWKEDIVAGNASRKMEIQGKFWLLYCQFHYDDKLPYFWLYLTPSTCGLRFVLKTDRPIINEAHYIQVVKHFLAILYRKTNGKVNPAFFDIRVNQAWFVPTFLKFFSLREDVFEIKEFQGKPVEKKESFKPYVGEFQKDEEQRFSLAIQFTERNYRFFKGQRNNYIHHLACNCNRFGLPKTQILIWIKSKFDLEEIEIENAVDSAYKHNVSEHGTFLK